MMKRTKGLLAVATVFTGSLFLSGGTYASDEKFTLCFSHYTGWEPAAYIDHADLMPEGEVVFYGDYVESVIAFTNGNCDAVTVTNMDALAFPATSGIDTSFIVIGDTSNGNDGIVMKSERNDLTAQDLAGKEVRLMELTVSHYLLARYLEQNGMSERDLTIVNTAESEIGAIFVSQDDPIVATWNPILLTIQEVPNAQTLFTSAQIPGEIIDGIIVRTDADESIKKAIASAWYKAMAIMSGEDEAADNMIAFMADYAGSTVEQFKSQLETTAMLYTPADALAFYNDKKLEQTMDFVRKFSYDAGLFGDAPSVDVVGIELPDGTVLGDPKNIKLRFDNSFTQQLIAQ